jgi:hyperosmotically inducible periplasmic protein
MKPTRKLLFLAAFVLASASTYAQTASTDSATSGATAGEVTPVQQRTARKEVRAEDRQLGKKIRQVLYKTKGLQDTDIVVFARAKTGNVVLAGFVGTEDQDHIATAAVEKISGVKSVVSKLTLREEGGH